MFKCFLIQSSLTGEKLLPRLEVLINNYTETNLDLDTFLTSLEQVLKLIEFSFSDFHNH